MRDGYEIRRRKKKKRIEREREIYKRERRGEWPAGMVARCVRD